MSGMFLGHTHAEWEEVLDAIDKGLATARLAAVAHAARPATVPAVKAYDKLTTEELWELYKSLPEGKAKAEFYRNKILPRIAQAHMAKDASATTSTNPALFPRED